MKKLLVLILFFSMTYVQAQPLMLSCRKACVKAELRNYAEYTRVSSNSDQLNYQKGDILISYGFEKVPWGKICTFASITMPKTQEQSFIDKKTGCNCWLPIENDGWVFETHMFDSPVMVRRTYEGALVTFKYAFDY